MYILLFVSKNDYDGHFVLVEPESIPEDPFAMDPLPGRWDLVFIPCPVGGASERVAFFSIVADTLSLEEATVWAHVINDHYMAVKREVGASEEVLRCLTEEYGSTIDEPYRGV